MHELSICHALVNQLQSVALDHHASKIYSITIGIGPLSGVEAHLLQQAWPMARVGTMAGHARLVIEELPIRVHCNSCGQESNASANRLLCAHCGDWQTRLISGDELMLLSVELDRTDQYNNAGSSQQEARHV